MFLASSLRDIIPSTPRSRLGKARCRVVLPGAGLTPGCQPHPRGRGRVLLKVSPSPGEVWISSQNITRKPSAPAFSFGDTKQRKTVSLKTHGWEHPQSSKSTLSRCLFFSGNITHSQQNVAGSVFQMSSEGVTEKLLLWAKCTPDTKAKPKRLCACLRLYKTRASPSPRH